jgi:hypothetical protein
VCAGRAVPAGRGEGEPGPARRPGPGAFPVARGFRAGASVPDGVPVLVGHRHAPRRRGVPRGGGGQVAGQPRVDGPEAGQFAGAVREVGQGAQRDGQGDSPGEPGGPGAACRPTGRRPAARAAGAAPPAGAVRPGAVHAPTGGGLVAGAGVCAQQQELRILRSRAAPGQLGDDGELAGRGVGLDPVPRAHQPDQLGLGHPAEPVINSGRVGGHRQLRAAGQHIQRHPGPEPGRPAG